MCVFHLWQSLDSLFSPTFQFDRPTKKTFLKRVALPGANELHFYRGAKVSVFGRQIRLIDYADEATRKLLTKEREK